MAPAYSKIVRSGITDIGSNNTTPAMPPNVTEGGPAPAGGFFDNPVVYRVMAFVFIASVGLVKRKVLKKLFLSMLTLTKTQNRTSLTNMTLHW